MEETNDVNRDTWTREVGAPEGDIPDEAIASSIPRTEEDHSDSDTSSKAQRSLESNKKPIDSDEEGDVFASTLEQLTK